MKSKRKNNSTSVTNNVTASKTMTRAMLQNVIIWLPPQKKIHTRSTAVTCSNFGHDWHKLFPHAFFCNPCDQWDARDSMSLSDISALVISVLPASACSMFHHPWRSLMNIHWPTSLLYSKYFQPHWVERHRKGTHKILWSLQSNSNKNDAPLGTNQQEITTTDAPWNSSLPPMSKWAWNTSTYLLLQPSRSSQDKGGCMEKIYSHNERLISHHTRHNWSMGSSWKSISKSLPSPKPPQDHPFLWPNAVIDKQGSVGTTKIRRHLFIWGICMWKEAQLTHDRQYTALKTETLTSGLESSYITS